MQVGMTLPVMEPGIDAASLARAVTAALPTGFEAVTSEQLTTEQVAAAVRVCARHGLAITPQGGNTGLVGGQIPQGEVLLSLKRMRAVRAVMSGAVEKMKLVTTRGGETGLVGQ